MPELEDGQAATRSGRLKPLIKPVSVVFANAKGGVGKSTLALMASLGLAVQQPKAHVELIDLDTQGTSSESLKRFNNDRFSVVENEEFFLTTGQPNNGCLINHLSLVSPYTQQQKYIVFDSPAGNTPARSAFLLHCDAIFVPTSVGDADIFATTKYLDALFAMFARHGGIVDNKLPPIVVLPNMIDSRAEFNEVRASFADYDIYLGKPLYYSQVFRRAFRTDDQDVSVGKLLRHAKPYVQWITSLIRDAHSLPQPPHKLFQL